MRRGIIAALLCLLPSVVWAQVSYYPPRSAGGASAGVTYTVAASNSSHVAGADYTCDGTADEVQINAAIQALPSTGGRVLLLDGTYTINAPIVAKSGMWLQGQGPGTIIQIVTGHAGSINMVSATTDGSNVNVTISDLTLDANGITTIIGVNVSKSTVEPSNVVIARNTIKNATGTSYGVYCSAATDLLIQDNVIMDWADSVIEVKALTRGRIARNSLVRGNLQIYAKTVSGTYSRDISIQGNTFVESSITITDDGATITNLSIVGNIWTCAATTPALGREINLKKIDGLVMSSNSFDASGSNRYSDRLIELASTVTNATVVGNVIKTGTDIYGNGYGGILLAAPGALVESNIVYTVEDYTYGIKVAAAATGSVIRNNRFTSNSGTHTHSTCIDIASSTSVTLDANICQTWDAVGISVAVTSATTQILDNQMLGTVATPYSILDTTALFKTLAPMVFTALPADVADGSLVYCSDCTIAAPCAAGGTGAMAKRLNNTWACN